MNYINLQKREDAKLDWQEVIEAASSIEDGEVVVYITAGCPVRIKLTHEVDLAI